MNSRRLIAVVGAAALAACLTACSAGTNTDASGSSSAAAGAAANTDTASTPGAPTAPATANYTTPEGNQVAPHKAIRQATEFEHQLSLLPGLEQPLAVWAAFDRITSQEGYIHQMVIGISEERLFKD